MYQQVIIKAQGLISVNGLKIWNSTSDQARKATTLKEYISEYRTKNR